VNNLMIAAAAVTIGFVIGWIIGEAAR